MKVSFLNIIGHGTTGSDNIQPGNHLRWSFNDKLGFPECFRLYYRTSKMRNRFDLSLKELVPGKLKLPYKKSLNQNFDFSFQLTSSSLKGDVFDTIDVVKELVPAGASTIVLKTDGELTIRFSALVIRIELVLYGNFSNFQIIALSKEGEFYPYTITPTVTGIRNISFDAPQATGIVLRGTKINLAGLAVWRCDDKDDAGWENFNQACGCGLPVNQKRTEFIEQNYSPLIGTDLAIALCRLGYLTVQNSPITAADFILLKAMILSMLPEGRQVPVGWTIFSDDETNAGTGKLPAPRPVLPAEVADQANVEMSKYDYLLAQSMHVDFAKILGLYFVDAGVPDDSYYDYMVTTEWPASNKRRLDHQLNFEQYSEEYSFFPISPLDENLVCIAPAAPVIVVAPYPLARTSMALSFSTTSSFPYTTFNFIKPVTEVQLVIINPGFNSGASVYAEAYKSFHSAYVDREELGTERGMLRLRAEQINSVKIFGAVVILSSLGYDFDPYPTGLQSAVICGLKKQDQLLPVQPSGLNPHFIPGGTVTDDEGNITEKPYLSGLHWSVNENPLIPLISISPVLYHLQRKTGSTAVESLTGDSPLFIAPSLLESSSRDVPTGWPQERLYHTESIGPSIQYFYQSAAQDLFGRRSLFSNFVTYTPQLPRPPHPEGVDARFLDYGTYDPATDTTSDQTINETDKAWLRINKKNAIVVRWKWSENLQLQAPDVEGFRIHYKAGWLNNFTGSILTAPAPQLLAKTALQFTSKELEQYPVLAQGPPNVASFVFQVSLHFGEAVNEDTFRLCWLTQGKYSFLVLKNTAGNQPTISVQKPGGAATFVPEKDKGFGIALTAGKRYFVDYKEPLSWTDTSIIENVTKNLTPKTNPGSNAFPIFREDYTMYIKNPPFPNPPFAASDTNKVRYGQIGVNSFIGPVFGSVSPASTIMAVYRKAPPAPVAFLPLQGTEINALKAVPADVYGKSIFHLRWSKTSTGLKYHIYRAIDETLFSVDNQVRQSRSPGVYVAFQNKYPGFNNNDVNVVKRIVHEPNPALLANHYAALTPAQLQILASLPDNQSAFTRINEKPIDENDSAYADRVTEIPDPVSGAEYVPDPEKILVYSDHTLGGKSTNHYFYGLLSIDSNGLQSGLSLSTPPVEIPKTTAPPVPVITSLSGGENQIKIRWAKNPGVSIAGYLLYKTPDRKFSHDWRRMQLVKNTETDLFTVTVTGALPEKEFEFVDAGVAAMQQFYYAVVAVGLNEDGKWLRSRASVSKCSQAYDLTTPGITS